MPQPIAGVAPSQLDEVTVMAVWPSLSATGFGRFWGRLYALAFGFRLFGVPVTVGRLLALASSPLMAALYFLMRLPRLPLVLVGFKNPWSWQYRLTNRRLLVEHPFGGEIRSIALDRFDTIDVEVQPGQAWYKAGDLVFRRGQVEVFRIWGVPRPETFRQICLKTHISHVGVQRAREMGVAV
jgi:hypothetical protein